MIKKKVSCFPAGDSVAMAIARMTANKDVEHWKQYVVILVYPVPKLTHSSMNHTTEFHKL